MINYKHNVVQYDLAKLFESKLDLSPLKGTSVLITGASGMLASYFTFVLLALNEQRNFGIRITLLGRNLAHIHEVFGTHPPVDAVLIQDVCNKIELLGPIDYIFHAAGYASAEKIISDPTGIIDVNTRGMRCVLELARHARVRKVLFTSSREVYGKMSDYASIRESDMGILDPLDPRSCYPESKRLAETMLTSYASQYNVPFNTFRIAHCYGPGIRTNNDGRIMSDLLRNATNHEPAHLHTTGSTERAFCYVTDAISAILYIILYGETNHAYNIANETEPVTIRQLAELTQVISGVNRGVTVLTDNGRQGGYTSYRRVPLNTEQLEALGWQPAVTLRDGIKRTYESLTT